MEKAAPNPAAAQLAVAARLRIESARLSLSGRPVARTGGAGQPNTMGETLPSVPTMPFS